MLILLIATFFISLLLFFISLFPGVFMTGKYEWILIFRNPYHMDFEFINSPPSNFHWFGTDLNSYDVFSILLFSISAFLFISYIISLIRFRIALDFKNATDNIIMRSNRMNFYQVLGSFPSIPILMLISILLFPLINWLTFYLLLLLIMSIFSWVDTSELLEFNKETKGKETFLSKMFRPIILKSTSSIFLNLIILSYLDVTRGNFPRIGRLLRDSQYNMPTTYWWTWLFPIVIIAFTIALLRSDRDHQ